jgi:hypothetical protein
MYFFRSRDESLLLGVVYAAALAVRLPKQLTVREVFPLCMLYLFLLVLSEAPTRLFTFSLIYTTRALILFRGLVVSLAAIQSHDGPTERKELTWTLGLTLEFILSTILVYSTFQPISPTTVSVVLTGIGGVLMLFTFLFTPFWIPGLLFGALSFSPITRLWGILGFVLLALYESNFSQKSRNLTTRIL